MTSLQKKEFICISECTSPQHCTKANKNICKNNKCECNPGYVPAKDSCTLCQPNQIVLNNECKDCPLGTYPTLDRLSCVSCEDDKISDNGTMCMKCTSSQYTPIEDINQCIKGGPKNRNLGW